MSSKAQITIPPADDFHHHFRDGEVLKDTVKHACRMFRRAVSSDIRLKSTGVTQSIAQQFTFFRITLPYARPLLSDTLFLSLYTWIFHR